MTFEEFLTRVIDDGILAARKDYTKPEQKSKLKGSIEGFDACRGMDLMDLVSLLTKAKTETHEAMTRFYDKKITDDEYWRIRCKEAEIEWVCNCVSALLMNEGKPVIVPPTARAVLKAAEIVGMKEEAS